MRYTCDGSPPAILLRSRGAGSPLVMLRPMLDVLNDSGQVDLLTGGEGTDWYQKATDDVIADLLAEETLDSLS